MTERLVSEEPIPEPSLFAESFTEGQREWLLKNKFHIHTLAPLSISQLTEIEQEQGRVPTIGKKPRNEEQEAIFNQPAPSGEIAIRTFGDSQSPLDPATIGTSAAEMFTKVGDLNLSGQLPDGLMATVGSPAEIAQIAASARDLGARSPYERPDQPYTLTSARYGIDENVFVGGHRSGRGMTVVARDPHRLDQLRNEPDAPFGLTVVYRPTTDSSEDAPQPSVSHHGSQSRGEFRYNPEQGKRTHLPNLRGALLQSALDGDEAVTSIQLATMMFGTIDEMGEARARNLVKNHLGRVRPFFDAYGVGVRSILSSQRSHPNEHHYTVLPPVVPETDSKGHHSNIVSDPAFFVLGYMENHRRVLEACGMVLPESEEIHAVLETSTEGEEYNNRTQHLPEAIRHSHREEIRRTAVRIIRMAIANGETYAVQEPLQPGMKVLYKHVLGHAEQATDLLYVLEHNNIAPFYERHGHERRLTGYTLGLPGKPDILVPTNGNGNGNASHL